MAHGFHHFALSQTSVLLCFHSSHIHETERWSLPLYHYAFIRRIKVKFLVWWYTVHRYFVLLVIKLFFPSCPPPCLHIHKVKRSSFTFASTSIYSHCKAPGAMAWGSHYFVWLMIEIFSLLHSSVVFLSISTRSRGQVLSLYHYVSTHI